MQPGNWGWIWQTASPWRTTSSEIFQGAKAAGIGCNIIFRSPEKKHPVEFTEETRPDAVIDTFPELLELLPPLK